MVSARPFSAHAAPAPGISDTRSSPAFHRTAVEQRGLTADSYPSMTNRVLVVDDEADIAELLTYNFQEAGYEVLTASDGINPANKQIAFSGFL